MNLLCLEWEKKEGEICIREFGQVEFDTLAKAKEMCLEDKTCNKISDRYCSSVDNKGYKLCKTREERIHVWEKGCTYEKPGNYIC